MKLKVTNWTLSQLFFSLDTYLIQLYFLHIDNIELASQGSILLTLCVMFNIIYRRTYLEFLIQETNLLFRNSIYFWTASIFTIFIFILAFEKWQAELIFIFCALFFVTCKLDEMRFIGKLKQFYIIQFVKYILFYFIGHFNLSSLYFYCFMIILIIYTTIPIAQREYTEKIFRKPYINGFKFFEFILASSVGFIAPFLVYKLVGPETLLELRTAQNFLSLGNLFVLIVYYTQTQRLSHSNAKSVAVYATIPSIILFCIFLVQWNFNRSLFQMIWGPYFYKVGIEIIILIVSLTPIAFNSIMTQKLLLDVRSQALMKLKAIIFLLNVILFPYALLQWGLKASLLTLVMISILETIFLIRKKFRN